MWLSLPQVHFGVTMANIVFNSPITVDYYWTDFQALVTSKGLFMQHLETDQKYTVFAVDGPIGYRCFLWKLVWSSDPTIEWPSDYSEAQNDIDLADFEIHKATSNKPLSVKTTDGRIRTAFEKSSGTSFNFYSHNWCDKTTWYSEAPRVVDEVATANGTWTVYSLAHQFMIDTYHAKITQEDFLKDPNGNSYRVTVKVDGLLKEEQDPHYGTGGDYTVNYASGTITFLSALTSDDTVTVTYHYAGSSAFTVKPLPGKVLNIDIAECQFSLDVSLKDTIVYQPRGYVDFFAPQYLKSNGGPYDPGTLIPLGNPFMYKSVNDLLNDSFKAYPTYPAIGSGWRSIQSATTVFEWDYTRQKDFSSAAGMEIRCSLQHDTPFDGTMATVTFYCSTVDE